MRPLQDIPVAATLALAVSSPAYAIDITQNDNATDLANNVIGSGVSLVGNPSFQGASQQAGTFTNGLDALDFGSGIVLGTGNVSDIPGANGNTNTPESRGVGSVDEDLDENVATSGCGEITNSFDCAKLAFDFEFGDGTVGGDLNFAFTFASEEYIDFVGSAFNDEFQLLVNGTNLATLNGVEVNINNINDQSNSGAYVNNIANTNGIPNAALDFKFDGRTTQLVASISGLSAGVHSAEFLVADVADSALDSGVFIQQGSFNPDDPDIPVPATIALLGAGLVGLGLVGCRRDRA